MLIDLKQFDSRLSDGLAQFCDLECTCVCCDRHFFHQRRAAACQGARHESTPVWAESGKGRSTPSTTRCRKRQRKVGRSPPIGRPDCTGLDDWQHIAETSYELLRVCCEWYMAV